jgi:hypothetical protein
MVKVVVSYQLPVFSSLATDNWQLTTLSWPFILDAAAGDGNAANRALTFLLQGWSCSGLAIIFTG